MRKAIGYEEPNMQIISLEEVIPLTALSNGGDGTFTDPTDPTEPKNWGNVF